MEDNSLFKRLKRYGETSGALGQLALEASKSKLLNRPETISPEFLTTILGQLKGPAIKAAQMLSTIPDMLPEEYTQALSTLQTAAPPMGSLFVNRRMRAELGPEWREKFASFDDSASMAASLGQVHRAHCHDGSAVACKLQYPDMQSVITADVSQLKTLLAIYENIHGALDTQDIFQEIEWHLLEELNYQQEAENLTTFADIFSNTPQIRVPRLYPELSTGRLLTTSWLAGEPLAHFVNESQDTRNKMAVTMFFAWYHPLYRHDILHGDPHLGNYTFTQDGHVNLFDFGCVRRFDPPFIQEGVLGLYRGLRTNNMTQMKDAYRAWGFPDLSPALFDILNDWARFLYGPILEDAVLDIAQTHPSRQGQQVASRILKALKETQGLCPPRSFVLMDRAAVGMGSVFLRLRAQLNWHRLFEDLIAGASLEALYPTP